MDILNRQQKEPDGRIAYWDNVKFLMIVFMVIGHFVNVFTDESQICRSIYLFIYVFHMPVLMFVSGVFCRNVQVSNKVVFYITCGFALKAAFTLMSIWEGYTPAFSLLSDSGIPWFMFVLAAFQLLNYLLREINRGFLLAASITLACFVGYDSSVGDWMYLSRTVVFFPFFLLGTMLSDGNPLFHMQKNKRAVSILTAGTVVAAWLYLCVREGETLYLLRPLFNGRTSFPEMLAGYGPWVRFLCYIITVLTGTSMLILIPHKRIPFFTELGKHTLNVYFWHWIIFRFLEKMFQITALYRQSVLGKGVYLLIALGISAGLAGIKVFDHPLKDIKKWCFTADCNMKKQS